MPAPAVGEWPAGAVVLWRYRRRDRISHVQTTRVVADTADWLALYWGEGYPRIESTMANGRALKDTPVPDRYLLPRVHQATAWRGPGSRVLCMVPRAPAQPTAADGQPAYSVWLMWEAGQPACYYINLEAPHQQWQHGDLRGVDTVDHELDVLVSPDRARWRFKDEREFEVATGLPGYWTAEEAARIRATAEVARARVLAGEPALDDWSYRPTSSWTLPKMPTNWDYEP